MGQIPINENIEFTALERQSYTNDIIGLARANTSSALAIINIQRVGPYTPRLKLYNEHLLSSVC